MLSARQPALALSLLAALIAPLAACSRREEAPAPPPAAPPPAATIVAPALPPPPLGREEVLRATADAAAAQAARAAYPETAARLSGRQFRLRLPFGCFGPAEDASLAYAYDQPRGVLRLTARPQAWTGTPLAALAQDGAPVEAVEGFWIRRPWLLAETCPSSPPASTGAQPSSETVGLAQVFEKGGSRIGRRGGQPYELTRKAALDPGWMAGFRLVLEGRIAQAEGRPIRCRSDHPDRRPVCLIRVELDRVAFETAGGEVLGEWDG